MEKGCSGGCGRDVLKISFHKTLDKKTWTWVGSLEKNDESVLVYKCSGNTETMCCSGYIHYTDFKIAPRNSFLDSFHYSLSYEDAIKML